MKSTKKLICIALALILALSCAVLAGCGSSKDEVKGITPATSSKATEGTTTAASSKATEGTTNAKTDSSVSNDTKAVEDNTVEDNTIQATLPYTYTTTAKDAEPYKPIELDGYKKPYKGTSKTVAINVKNHGTITVVLNPTYAPITVQNFLNLVNEGFYDGLTFHRIIKNFMVQGGDPKGNGTGGSDISIKGEFKQNGVTNPVSHKRGVISMARSNAYDSASSQFFIVHDDSPHLDGQYAAFGAVTDGMNIVDELAENTPVVDSNGTVLPANQPVIESIKIVE